MQTLEGPSVKTETKVRPIIMISAASPKRTMEENISLTRRLKAILDNCGISYRKAISQYNDELRHLFIVDGKWEDELQTVIFGLLEQGQYLFIDNKDEGYLVQGNGIRRWVGKMQRRSPYFCIDNPQYFAVIGYGGAFIFED